MAFFRKLANTLPVPILNDLISASIDPYLAKNAIESWYVQSAFQLMALELEHLYIFDAFLNTLLSKPTTKPRPLPTGTNKCFPMDAWTIKLGF